LQKLHGHYTSAEQSERRTDGRTDRRTAAMTKPRFYATSIAWQKAVLSQAKDSLIGQSSWCN